MYRAVYTCKAHTGAMTLRDDQNFGAIHASIGEPAQRGSDNTSADVEIQEAQSPNPESGSAQSQSTDATKLALPDGGGGCAFGSLLCCFGDEFRDLLGFF